MANFKFSSAILFMASFLLLSCSDDSDGGNDYEKSSSSSSLSSSSFAISSSAMSSSDDGYSEIVKIYALEDRTGGSFAYTTEEEWYECEEGGELTRKTANEYKNTVNYSISNNAMVWQNLNHEDTLNFTGTSNNLIGIWTRKYDREATCERLSDGWSCKLDWNIVKAEFTEDTLKITNAYCQANFPENYEASNGWKVRNISCNTYEYYKETDKITVKIVPNSMSYAYKGKTCVRNFAVSDRAKVCKDAWAEFQKGSSQSLSNYYNTLLVGDFKECLQNTLPAEFFEDDDE
ncbi:MAG: hypothetical protein FWC26_00030 [Fibromonadales bacterium]|nr:hypothetical protein [Fibromonadales bacterium]